MQNLKGKSLAILIAAILTFSMAAAVTLIPNASAHSPPWIITDHAYVVAEPSPVGVGQAVSISFWTAQPLPATLLTNNIRKGNYTVTVTSPNGAISTLWTPSDYVANPGGEQAVDYTPIAIGTYTVNFVFGGITYPTLAQVSTTEPLSGVNIALINAYAGDEYTPGSATTNFTVQQTPLSTLSFPLPTDYWTNPIDGQNWNWYVIASNWLGPSSYQLGSYQQTGFNSFQPSGIAPTSAHIMWTNPLEFGGVVGGTSEPYAGSVGVNGATYYSGSSYQPRIYNDLIMDGYLYYKLPYGGDGTPVIVNGAVYGGGYVCIDLATGKIVWENTSPDFNPTWGQLYNEIDPNQSGIIPSGYLWQSYQIDPAIINPVTGSTIQEANVTWIAYDADTGNWDFNLTNIPQAISIYGHDPNTGSPTGCLQWEQTTKQAMDSQGDMLLYILDYNTTSETGTLALWNSTACIENLAVPQGPYRPEGRSIDASTAHTASNPAIYYGTLSNNAAAAAGIAPTVVVYNPFTWIVPITADLDGWAINATNTDGVSLTGPTINAVIVGDVIMGQSNGLASIGPGTQYTPNPWNMWALNLNASTGVVGSTLFVENYTALYPMGNSDIGAYTLRILCLDPTTNIIVVQCSETFELYGYNLFTGALVWGPTTTAFTDGYQYYGGGLGPGQVGIDAYGNVYIEGYGGEVYCYAASNGALLWQFGNGGEGNSTNDGINSPWGLLPTEVSDVADGMVYVYTTQHGNGAQSPYYLGEMQYCLNATTGQEIWGIYFQGSNDGGPGYPQGIVANGAYVASNYYDNQVYDFSQGPSATTVTAPQTAITSGQPVMIQGTVMDISPGTKQTEQAADFPNGVPVASDASESQWMEYVYMQKPEPTNFTGVTVTLTAIDPNHNYVTLGTATTTDTGLYTLTWTPPSIPGNYLITATFAGTNGYYGSSAQTGMTVQGPSATAAPTPAPVTGLASTATVELGIAAVIIVIVIAIAILGLLLLRKKP